MQRSRVITSKQESFLNYLIEKSKRHNIPILSIKDISNDMGISTSSVRELLELARNLGFIKAQPRKGIEILPYRFNPAVAKSLYYAVKVDRKYYDQFSNVRNHLEKSYFLESAALLTTEDIARLLEFTKIAKRKLYDLPVQIPHQEHREFHLEIYKRLENVFVNGFFKAYWDTYELIGLNLYEDLPYLKRVWGYHQKIADNIQRGDLQIAYEILLEHMELIGQR